MIESVDPALQITPYKKAGMKSFQIADNKS